MTPPTPFDHRGMFRSRLELTFFGGGDLDVWRGYAESIGMERNAEDSLDFSIAAVSNETLFLADVHEASSKSAEKTDKDSHWHLTLRPKPAEPAPERVLEQTRRLGGYPNALSLMADHWPEDRKEIKQGIVQATFAVQKSRFESVLGHPKSQAVGGRHAVPLSVMWNLKPVGDIIDEVAIFHEDDHLVLVTKGAWSGTFGADVFERLDGALWRQAKLLLKRKNGLPKGAVQSSRSKKTSLKKKSSK